MVSSHLHFAAFALSLHALHVYVQTGLVGERPIATTTHEHARDAVLAEHVRAEILVRCNLHIELSL